MCTIKVMGFFVGRFFWFPQCKKPGMPIRISFSFRWGQFFGSFLEENRPEILLKIKVSIIGRLRKKYCFYSLSALLFHLPLTNPWWYSICIKCHNSGPFWVKKWFSRFPCQARRDQDTGDNLYNNFCARVAAGCSKGSCFS